MSLELSTNKTRSLGLRLEELDFIKLRSIAKLKKTQPSTLARAIIKSWLKKEKK